VLLLHVIEALKQKRRNFKIVATPNDGAKNYCGCPKGYMRHLLMKTAIGPGKAIALLGCIPTRRAISNCLIMKTMKAKVP